MHCNLRLRPTPEPARRRLWRATEGFAGGDAGSAWSRRALRTFIACSLLGAQAINGGKKRVAVHIARHHPLTGLRLLKASLIGRFISARATVVRVSSARPCIQSFEFDCLKCGAPTCTTPDNGEYKMPTRCGITGCSGKSFTPKLVAPGTVYRNYQTIR